MKYTFHVPTQQYGYLEISGEETDLPQMEQAYNRYAETPINFKKGNFVTLESFTGETVLYDELNHEYKDGHGNPLIGGSTYAKQFEKPFNAEQILPVCAKAWNVSEKEIKDIWDKNAKVSTSFGESIHTAIESYHLYHKQGKQIKDNKKDQATNYALPKNGLLRKAVESFVKEFGADATPEVLVSDVKNGRVGQIDLLKIIENKVCRVQDIKTSVMDKDKMKVYQRQLSYYAHILMAHGYTVEGLDIFGYEGEWKHTKLEVLDIKENK